MLQGWTKDEFLERIAEHYADVDWDNLPPLDSKPGRWKIVGVYRPERRVFSDGSPVEEGEFKFTIRGSWDSEEDLAKELARLKNSDRWNKEDNVTINEGKRDQYIAYRGAVQWERTETEFFHDDELAELHFYKEVIDNIDDFEFPLHPP